jgi:hypothetical protein
VGAKEKQKLRVALKYERVEGKLPAKLQPRGEKNKLFEFTFFTN